MVDVVARGAQLRVVNPLAGRDSVDIERHGASGQCQGGCGNGKAMAEAENYQSDFTKSILSYRHASGWTRKPIQAVEFMHCPDLGQAALCIVAPMYYAQLVYGNSGFAHQIREGEIHGAPDSGWKTNFPLPSGTIGPLNPRAGETWVPVCTGSSTDLTVSAFIGRRFKLC